MKKIKRHVDNTANKGQTVDDYYAQRKAVMERFYARQREINRKYQGNVSTTTESPQRYDLGLKLVENTVPSPERQNEPVNRNAITSGKNDLQSQTETRKASDNVKRPRMANTEDNDYDEYYDEDETTPLNVTPLGISITVSPVVDVHSWGQCNNPGLILFYEHHLRIHVHEASMAEADLTASAGESFCVACITTVPLTPTKAKISYKARHGNQREPKLVITGTRNEQLTFDVKFYAALKTNGHC
ncbi:hypothetical protein WN55_04363 [Dufourea novaeangliae]|uniref:Uncharacterized protein n=1 Tax=Dufourea novaeangliae TaxID=178035 RepID=A0A154PLV2_DUFNO|nr:hypothetical protein WN55_04363 [Dufourea novaeangliae]